MILLDCSCKWQNVIDGIPWLCGCIIFVVGFLVALSNFLKFAKSYYSLKYVEHPIIKYIFEEASRQKAFEREKEWDDRKKTKSQTQKTIDNLKEQVEDLRNAIYGSNNKED